MRWRVVGWLTPGQHKRINRAAVRGYLVVAAVAWISCDRPPLSSRFTLRVAVSGSLEPVSPTTDPRNWAVVAQPWVFEPLVRIDDRGQIIPVLAAQVETFGPAELRLWVRTDARFEDGSPITFDDVATSIAMNRLRATRAPGGSIFIESLEKGVPPEVLLARTPVFKKTLGHIVGTGPFRIRAQDPSHILLERRQRTPRGVERIILRSYATPKEAFAHTLRGDVDLLPDAEPRWLEFFEGVPRLRVVRAAETHANIIAFNIKRLSKNERIALVHMLSTHDVRLQAFGSDCLAPNDHVRDQPLPPGRPLNVIAIPIFDRFALAVRRALGRRGGDIRIVELNAYFDAIKTGDFDLAAARPQITPPSMAALLWRTGATINVLGYSNPKVDAALDARDWAAAQRALDDDPPAAFVCTRPNIMVVDSRIKNAFSPVDVPQWEIGP